MSLHALVGHEKERETLGRARAKGTLPAALLLHGPRGVGKQRLALWLAQLLVCEASGNEPCGTCRGCRMASVLEHPDMHWYFPLPRPKGAAGDRLGDALEQARHEELAEIRSSPLRTSRPDGVRGLYLATVRAIRGRAILRPVMARQQVFIIGDAELLVPQESSPEAANALLKLLEEPPATARFVLTSSEPGRLPDTVRSRTVPLHLAPLREDQVAAFLRDVAGVDEEAASWAARLAQGAPGRALGFLAEGDDKGPADRLRRQAYDLVSAALAPKPADAHGVAAGFPPAGARGLVDLFAFVEEWLRDLAAVAAGAGASVLNHDALQALEKRVADRGLRAHDLARSFDAVERARVLAQANVNPQLVVSGLLHDVRAALAAGGQGGTTA